MNRVDAICSQIKTIAEHITGPEGFSLTSLCQVRDAILDAHDLIAGEIIKREATISKPPEGGVS